MVDFNRDNTLPRDIVDEMKESYLNYSMSVIVSRALPDVRGLKPVHRRILYGMSELGQVGTGLIKNLQNSWGCAWKISPTWRQFCL